MRDTNYADTTLITPGITLTKILIGINVIVFAALSWFGDPQDSEFMLRSGAFWVPAVIEGHEYYRFLTPVFMHFSFSHLFNNMLLLLFMGDILERAIGTIRFAVLYLGSGILGNVLTWAVEFYTGSYSVSAGASGAISGVLGALLCLLLIHHGHVSYLTGGRMVFFVLYSLFAGFTSTGVNNAAHVGGLTGGFLIMLLLSVTMRGKSKIRSG